MQITTRWQNTNWKARSRYIQWTSTCFFFVQMVICYPGKKQPSQSSKLWGLKFIYKHTHTSKKRADYTSINFQPAHSIEHYQASICNPQSKKKKYNPIASRNKLQPGQEGQENFQQTPPDEKEENNTRKYVEKGALWGMMRKN